MERKKGWIFFIFHCGGLEFFLSQLWICAYWSEKCKIIRIRNFSIRHCWTTRLLNTPEVLVSQAFEYNTLFFIMCHWLWILSLCPSQQEIRQSKPHRSSSWTIGAFSDHFLCVFSYWFSTQWSGSVIADCVRQDQEMQFCDSVNHNFFYRCHNLCHLLVNLGQLDIGVGNCVTD